MKILIKLSSSFYSNELNQSLCEDRKEVEWNIPFLPRVGEYVDCERIIKDMPLTKYNFLSWIVHIVEYENYKGNITPVVWCKGE